MKLKNIQLFISTAFVIISALFVIVPQATPSVYAQQSNTTTSSTSGDKVQDGLRDIGQAFPANARTEKDVPGLIHTIIDWALYIAAIAAVIMIIYGGYQYIFSAGDSGKAGKGSATMVNALIGLTLIVLSYIIVQIVYNFLTKPAVTPGT